MVFSINTPTYKETEAEHAAKREWWRLYHAAQNTKLNQNDHRWHPGDNTQPYIRMMSTNVFQIEILPYEFKECIEPEDSHLSLFKLYWYFISKGYSCLAAVYGLFLNHKDHMRTITNLGPMHFHKLMRAHNNKSLSTNVDNVIILIGDGDILGSYLVSETKYAIDRSVHQIIQSNHYIKYFVTDINIQDYWDILINHNHIKN